MSIVLINVFEVPEGKDEAFLSGWQAAAQHLQAQPGYISTKLHQSVDPHASFRFVNVAEWESPQVFQAAINAPEFRVASQAIAFATAHPSLYRVVSG
jgi:heme-degrading monooxygenase HmoA